MTGFQKNTAVQSLMIMMLATTLACYAQQTVVKTAYAFDIVRIPGNIPVGDDGQPLSKVVDTSTIIYVETASRHIEWDTAWKDGRVFLLTGIIVEQTPIEAGVSKTGNEKMTLRPAPGNVIWRLQLIPLETVSQAGKRNRYRDILIRGRAKTKPFWHTITRRVELESIPSV
jgi:hypothetical protein